jgi:hypothetical protein
MRGASRSTAGVRCNEPDDEQHESDPGVGQDEGNEVGDVLAGYADEQLLKGGQSSGQRNENAVATEDASSRRRVYWLRSHAACKFASLRRKPRHQTPCVVMSSKIDLRETAGKLTRKMSG